MNECFTILANYTANYVNELFQLQFLVMMKEVNKYEDAKQILEVTNPYVERGRKLGREEGRKQKRTEERLSLARNMLADDFSIEQIYQLTKLDIREIEN